MKTTKTATISNGNLNLAQKNSLVMFVLMTIFLSLFSNTVKSNNIYKPKYDSLSCLEIEGKIVNPGVSPGLSYTVELVTNDGKIDTILLSNKSKFKFVLSRDSYYVIRISSEGYISKLVSVNTEILAETDGLYRFSFETSLLKEEALVHLNKDVTDMPIAIVYFDHDSNYFVYNKKYTNNLKKEMRKSKSFTNKTPMITTNSKGLAHSYTN